MQERHQGNFRKEDMVVVISVERRKPVVREERKGRRQHKQREISMTMIVY